MSNESLEEMLDENLSVNRVFKKRSVHIYCCTQVRKSSIAQEEKKKEKKFGLLRSKPKKVC